MRGKINTGKVIISSTKANTVGQHVMNHVRKQIGSNFASIMSQLVDVTLCKSNRTTCFCDEITPIELLANACAVSERIVHGARCAFCNSRGMLIDYYRREKNGADYKESRAPASMADIIRVGHGIASYLTCWAHFCKKEQPCTKCALSSTVSALSNEYRR